MQAVAEKTFGQLGEVAQGRARMVQVDTSQRRETALGAEDIRGLDAALGGSPRVLLTPTGGGGRAGLSGAEWSGQVRLGEGEEDRERARKDQARKDQAWKDQSMRDQEMMELARKDQARHDQDRQDQARKERERMELEQAMMQSRMDQAQREQQRVMEQRTMDNGRETRQMMDGVRFDEEVDEIVPRVASSPSPVDDLADRDSLVGRASSLRRAVGRSWLRLSMDGSKL